MVDATTTAIRPDEGMMALGTKSSIFLFVYYLLVLICAAFGAYTIQATSQLAVVGMPLIFCVLLSLVGSSIFYSRKLYKACISDSYNFQNGSPQQRAGTFFFFVLRPLFAASFAWITHMIWEASIVSSVAEFQSFSPTHLYLSGVLGFFVGFLTGRVLTRMEAGGDKYLKGIW